MKKVQRTLIVARNVSINCVENDRVDIKCGGPAWLGFDFTVDADEDPTDLRKWLEATLAEAGHPVRSLFVSTDTVEVPKVWSREAIKKEIQKTKF